MHPLPKAWEGKVLAFITGSRAYGIVTPKSDIDLVIRTDEETAERLRKLSDKDMRLKQAGDNQICIRFGRLNLIVCTTDEQFAVWRIGTTDMKRHGEAYNWQEAKEVFDNLREMVGILDIGESGPGKVRLDDIKKFTRDDDQ